MDGNRNERTTRVSQRKPFVVKRQSRKIQKKTPNTADLQQEQTYPHPSRCAKWAMLLCFHEMRVTFPHLPKQGKQSPTTFVSRKGNPLVEASTHNLREDDVHLSALEHGEDFSRQVVDRVGGVARENQKRVGERERSVIQLEHETLQFFFLDPVWSSAAAI